MTEDVLMSVKDVIIDVVLDHMKYILILLVSVDELNEIAFAIVLAISGSLEIV